MFLAMNRFQVRLGQEAAFEQIWQTRESYLNEVPGFIAFHLLRGPSDKDQTLYATHSSWASREAFEAWTHSEAFRKAHAGAGDNKPLYAGPPRLELFDSVLTKQP